MNNLAYETFSEEVLFRMQEKLGPERPVSIHKVLKNNNVRLDGIVVENRADAVSPTFYMEQFFEEYNAGATIDDIVAYACPFYEKHYGADFMDVSVFDSFENVKDELVFKLINREANKEFLKGVPYFTFLDLAIVFYCVMEDGSGNAGSVTIRNEIFKDWDVPKSALYEAAVKNTKRLFGIEIREIQDVIVDMLLNSNRFFLPALPEYLRQDLIEDIRGQVVRFPVYVLSNRSKVNGAVCMLYKEIGRFAEKIGDDLFIIPSSIHEVLLIPAQEKITSEELQGILCEVNRDELDERDYLSDKIYYYSRKSGKILLK